MPRYVHASRVFRRAPERLSALRPPSFGVSEAKVQDPDAEIAPRERDGLFETVNMATNTSEGTAVPDAAQHVTKWSQKRVNALKAHAALRPGNPI